MGKIFEKKLEEIRIFIGYKNMNLPKRYY